MSLQDISDKMSTEVLDEIVRKKGAKHHTNWSFGGGFKKGDSYISSVFRLKIEGIGSSGSPIEVNTIIKSLPDNPFRRKLFRSDVFFRNEINFYLKVIPAFERFQNGRNAKKPFNEYPQFYASYCNGINDFIALEDISPLGYGPMSRQTTLDLDHWSLIMKGLGRFHAVSLAFNDQFPDEFSNVINQIEETYYSEDNRKWYTPFLKDAIAVAIDAVSKEYPGTVYEEKAKQYISNDLYGSQIRLVNRRNKYSVIQHGDCWMPNFLFRYENNKPVDMKIIDFQLARYGSPAIDISFFTYSCTDNEMRTKHYDGMLRVYHESASELIRDLGSDTEKVFPYSALLKEMKEVAQFGCGMGIESLPLSMKEDDEIFDLDQIDNDNAILTDAWKIAPLQKKCDRLRIADTFKHAIDMEYIS